MTHFLGNVVAELLPYAGMAGLVWFGWTLRGKRDDRQRSTDRSDVS